MERAGPSIRAADKPFEHEARMKELLLRQPELDVALDLDKNETQVVPGGEQESVRLKSGDGAAAPPRVFSPAIQQNSIPAMSP